jgi:hypothetical protein
MYLDLGGETVIRSRDLIALFDLSGDKAEHAASIFADEHRLSGVQKIGTEETKSLVITKNGCYFSPVSVVTLKKRIQATGPFERVSNLTK